MKSPSQVVPFPPSVAAWIEDYQRDALTRKDSSTIRVYRHILEQFLQWVVKRSGKLTVFHPGLLTKTLVEQYLSERERQRYSLSHRKRIKSVINQFCSWLMETKGGLTLNPTHGILITKTQAQTTGPRTLSPVQREILCRLVKEDDRRGQALFALGYWAGCRVTDLVHLRLSDVHVGPRSGWLHLGGEGTKARMIDLMNEARRALYDYLQRREADQESVFVFLSQRGSSLTDAGLHHWFRTLKQKASPQEYALIADIAFHHLRDDFAARAYAAGWTLEEVAYYLGNVTMKGTPAVQTTIRYAQVSRAQVKEKLKVIKG